MKLPEWLRKTFPYHPKTQAIYLASNPDLVIPGRHIIQSFIIKEARAANAARKEQLYVEARP